MIHHESNPGRVEQTTGGRAPTSAGSATQAFSGAEITDRSIKAGEHVRDAAAEAVGRMREQGRSVVAEQKNRAAEELSHFGKAIHCAADTLREEGDDNIANYAELAAAKIDRATHYLQERDLGRLVDDAEEATRRRPELVYGGLFVAGLALSRFLKASARNRRDVGRLAHSQFPAGAY